MQHMTADEFWRAHVCLSDTAAGGSARPVPRFEVIRVSHVANELIEAVEAAAVALGMADTLAENHRAYSHVCAAREPLYQYVQALERRLGIERDAAKRF